MMKATIQKLKAMVASGEYVAPDMLDHLEGGARAAIYMSSDSKVSGPHREMLNRWANEAVRLLANGPAPTSARKP